MRRTKIICTLGPATESEEMLRKMVEAGTDIFRLNMSHANHDWVRMVSARIRKVSADIKPHVAILMDTQGPAIRTGDLAVKLDLKPGDIFEFTVRGHQSEEEFSVGVNYDGLVDDIAVGDTVLVDNGVIHLKVLEKNQHIIRCRVLTEGTMGSRRHINLPGVKVNLPPLTQKDLDDIKVGAEVGIDMLALSFVRQQSDIHELRAVLQSHGIEPRIIAKIEDQQAIKNIDEIIDASDAIMVARGDLGIECPMEDLPIIQRRVVKRCIRQGKQVIVATHMLESMISNPHPTRAEITDVANAVFEQADAIMLSGETTVGKYPLSCVEVLNRVARRIEDSGGAGYAEETVSDSERQKTVKSAVVLANSLEHSKLMVFTRKGNMANYMSTLRPASSTIFAFTPSIEVARRLTLNRGTLPISMEFETNPEKTIASAEKILIEKSYAVKGDKLVILSDIEVGTEKVDSIQLRTCH